NFTGGQYNLYDPSNNLLLSAPLGSSVLTGTIGPGGTGALFTTTTSSPTGGSLAPFIDPGSLSMSISLINVNGGAGFAVSGNLLQAFVADASVLISATPSGPNAPEPGTLGLLAAGGLFALVGKRMKRRTLINR